jgi:heme a synthase
MTRRFTTLAWTAAVCAYLLIVLGAIVRITGSGMGCGDHWPLCNGHLFPPLSDLGTVIEWSHRLVAALVSILVAGLACYTWYLRRPSPPSAVVRPPGGAAYVALGLLVIQVLLGAVTVKLALPPWTVVLHLGTAMLLLAALLVAASDARLTPGGSPGNTDARVPRSPGLRPGSVLLSLAFVTVLFGALTANLGAATACTGFPLCNGQLIPTGGSLQYIHWTHRLLAYALVGYVIWWATRFRGRKAWAAAALVGVQVAVAAAMVLLGLPGGLQAAHVAVGAGVWAAVVLAAR